MEMIKNAQQYGDYNEILARIPNQVSLEKFEERSLLFRTGERGDKFYIVLKGRVAIIVASPKTVKMNYKSYIQYLFTLRKEEEIEILHNT